MIMLTNYANNLFATRSNLNEALTQANDLYGKAMSTSDSIAMRTAVHIVLNTAIQQHTIELAAVYDKHAAEVRDLRSQLAAKPDPVTALLGLVDERVNAALADMDRVFADKFDAAIDSWADDNLADRMDNVFAEKFDAAADSWAADKLRDKMDERILSSLEVWLDGNLAASMDSWYGDNVDITDDIKKVIEDEIDLDDLVQEKVTNFFGNNSFSIEPR